MNEYSETLRRECAETAATLMPDHPEVREPLIDALMAAEHTDNGRKAALRDLAAAQLKVDRITALVAAYARGDEPEGAPSARRTLLSIGEILGGQVSEPKTKDDLVIDALEAIDRDVGALTQRVAALETRLSVPPGLPIDVVALHQRVLDLERKVSRLGVGAKR